MTHVLIIGSGLVGASMAIALARAGLRVEMIEAKNRREQLHPAFDGRTSAIALASVRILESIGVWQQLDDICAITDIRVCEHGGSHFVHYDHRDAGGEPFGYILENRLLREALYNTVDALDNIIVHEPCTLVGYEAFSTHIEAALSNGTTIHAPLMLVADGKFSQTRAMAGIAPELFEYGQTAIVASIQHSEPHHGLAVEAFFPAGPFAILPMTGNRSNIVWTESDTMAKHMLSLSDDAFLGEIQKRAGEHLGTMQLLGPRHSYPLMLIKAEAYVKDRLALIGDAGHGIHPIAGQGVNLGYRDVAVLAEMIVAQARLGLDIGSASLLADYAQRRESDVGSMVAATDMLNRLFSNHNPFLHKARDMGLGAVERVLPLKQFFMRHAMGMGGNIPKMMRGEAL